MEPFCCSWCDHTLLLPEYLSGRHLPCPHCQREIEVPWQSTDPRACWDQDRLEIPQSGYGN